MLSTKKIIAGISLGLVGMVLVQTLSGLGSLPLNSLNQEVALLFYVVNYNVLTWLLCKGIIDKLFQKKPNQFGLGKRKISLGQLFLGLALPVVIFGSIILAFPGQWHGIGSEVNAKSLIFGNLIYIGLVGSVVEEIVFRGLIYHALRQKFSIFPSAFISGLLFSLIHIFNPGWTFAQFIYFVMLSLAIGIYLALLTESSGHIWGAAWVHFVWNVANSLWNTSPNGVETSLLSYTITDAPPLFIGTEVGVLFTIPALVVLLLASTLLGIKLRKNH